MSDDLNQTGPEFKADPLNGNGEGAPADEVLAVFARGPNPVQPEPLDPGQAQTPPPTGNEGSPPPVVPVQAPVQTPAGEVPVPPTQTPGAPDPLASTLGKLNETLEKIGTPRAPENTTPPEYEKLPDYNYNVPDEIMTALGSENPAHAKAAVAAIATGISRQTHQVVLGTVKQMLEQAILPAIASRIQESIAASEVYRDFYSTHKDLADPRYRPIIENVAKQMLKPGVGWTPELRDAIANQAKALLNLKPGAPVAPVQPPPPVLTSGGSRGSVPQGGLSEEIMDLVNTR